MRPIDFDVECAGCGYNLRGRPALGRCPECGTRIGETIRAISARETGRSRWSRRWFAVPPSIGATIGAVVTIVVLGVLAASRGWGGVGARIGIDLVASVVIGLIIMAILRAPRSWLLPTLIEVYAALGLGTIAYLGLGEAGLGVLLLYGVPVIAIAVFTRVDPSDGLWFLIVIAALRVPHLLIG